jgi:hypothetical protein
VKPGVVVGAVGVCCFTHLVLLGAVTTAVGWWQSAVLGLVVALAVITVLAIRVYDRRTRGADARGC